MSSKKQSQSPAVDAFRGLPSVTRILESGAGREALSSRPHSMVVDAARAAQALARGRLVSGEGETGDAQALLESVLETFRQELRYRERRTFRRVINGTGVVVHTNLGRSLLSPEAASAVLSMATHYNNLEYDLNVGKRGTRYALVEETLVRLTGAEAAVVVNNNAAAVFLCLRAMAEGREVIVSRGQLVEIGGSFRMPDIMAASGVTMVEVGTTNKTHVSDYENAITERTALLLKVHSSNYRMVGFTHEVTLSELVALGRARGIPVIEDVGSGCLVRLDGLGAEPEPTVQEAVATGADLITFSGDKMLGGPQAGVIAGRKEWVDLVKKHPLMRMLRVDKMTLAALQATLLLFEEPDRAHTAVPTLAMLGLTAEQLSERAESLAGKIREAAPGVAVELIDGESQVGGGAMPLAGPATTLVAVTKDGLSPDALSEKLRLGDPPVIGRIADGRFLLDPRTLVEGDEDDIAVRIAEVAGDRDAR